MLFLETIFANNLFWLCLSCTRESPVMPQPNVGKTSGLKFKPGVCYTCVHTNKQPNLLITNSKMYQMNKMLCPLESKQGGVWRISYVVINIVDSIRHVFHFTWWGSKRFPTTTTWASKWNNTYYEPWKVLNDQNVMPLRKNLGGIWRISLTLLTRVWDISKLPLMGE